MSKFKIQNPKFKVVVKYLFSFLYFDFILMKTSKEIIAYLKSLNNEKNKAGMSRFGINTSKAFGVSIPVLRVIAKENKKNHQLALELWKTGYHEARILSAFIDNPKEVTEEQMENWVIEFNSWDVCDQCCGNLFDKTPFSYNKAKEWAHREEEFVRRAGFVLMASIAVHDKEAVDKDFVPFLKLIEKYAFDERNFVKKAVNWAVRQIGKRNLFLHQKAIETAHRIALQKHKSARWIASDALRELESDKIKSKLS
jgi:3-methyladenine DNA glycosylase AlkD